jgi:hypothetical protein
LKVLRAAKDAMAQLEQHEQALRESHRAKVQERDRTRDALASRADVHAHVDQLVDAETARWRDGHARGWVRTLSGYRETKVSGLASAAGERTREVRVRPRLPDIAAIPAVPGALTLHELCGLVPGVLKQSLHAMVDAEPDSIFGLPAAERADRLAELDREIADLETRHAALVDAARDVGIDLALLDTVRERREQEARAQEHARELTAARQAPAAPESQAWSVV